MFLFLLISLFFINAEQVSSLDQKIALAITAQDYMAMPLPIVSLEDSLLVKKIIKDAAFTGQLNPIYLKQKLAKSTIENLANQGYGLAIFVRQNGKDVEWSLYDNFSNTALISKKTELKDGLEHEIMDQIWPILFNNASSFNTVIAAVKINKNSFKSKNQIFILFPFDDRKPVAISKGKSNCCTPRFHPHKPALYYSQHTKTNVRLVGFEPTSKATFIVSSCDGLNMSPTISKNGKIALSIAPHGTSSLYEFTNVDNKKCFQRLTPAEVQVIAPCFIDENKLLCCAFFNKRPFVSTYDFTTKSLEKVLETSALAPSYCPINNRIYFVKKVDNFLQVFYYDCKTKQQVQLTKTRTTKDHPWPSSCGNFLVYTDIDQASRLVVYNLINNQINFITPENENWNSPSWSPKYLNSFV